MTSRVLPPVQHRGLALRSTAGGSRSKRRTPVREKPAAEFLVPTAARNTPRHNVCIDLLSAGNLESFVEVFDITEKDEDNVDIGQREDDLRVIAAGLKDAETAAREQQAELEYMTLKRLADFLEEKSLLKTARRFRARAQSAAQSFNNPQKLAAAQTLHGLLLEKIGDVEGASACFESALTVQKDAGIDVALTVGHIVRTKTAVGDALEAVNDMKSSLEVFTEAKDLALSNAQMEEATQCMYRMGNASERLGDALGAIEHLERYMSSPVRVDQASKNLACAVLARCYERLGGDSNTETALQYLEKLVETTKETGQTKLTEEAASSLGRIHGCLNNHADSIKWYTVAYYTAKMLDNQARVQELGVTLATARASALLPGMAAALQNATGETLDDPAPGDSLSIMLKWTSQRREGFTGGKFSTGFDTYDPVAEKAAKKQEFERKLQRRQSQVLDALGHKLAKMTAEATEKAAKQTLVMGMLADVDRSRTMDAVAASKPGTAASRSATPAAQS
eukprot:m.194742 g.194742  ORF g.194742 m.194742 type:complete len:509 (-) comp18661_c0_seq1:257-1783(-)